MVNPDGIWQRNTYDASGIRSMIAENGVTTEFMTFNGLVLSGYNKDGEKTEHYYYGNSLLTAEYTEYASDSYGDVTAETSLYYYLKNSHGDVIGLTDSNGTLTEIYRYDAFGTLANIQSLNENGVLTEAETALSRFLYAGEQLDAATGLYYLRARQYDTIIGRFTQEDTYLGDGRNLYVYVGNNPLKYVDPSGHCEKKQGYGVIEKDLYRDTIITGLTSGQKEDTENLAWLNALNAGFTTPDSYSGYLGQQWGNYIAPIVENDPIVSLRDTTLGAIDALWPVPTRLNEYVTYQEMYVTGLMLLSPISAGYGGSADNISDMFKMGSSGIQYAGEVAVAVESTVALNAELVYSVYMGAKNSALLLNSSGTMYSSLSNSNGTISTGGTPVHEKTIAANGLEYKSNPKHTPGQTGFRADAGIEPKNSLELFEQSVASTSKQNQRFTYDEKMGILHRFFEDGNGVWHWSGSTHQGINSLKGNQVPNDIKSLFNLPRKGW